jgi:isoleucyl-tRNA synthetase
MFSPASGQVRFPELETRILEFWKEHGIYEQTLKARAHAPRFVFYEGPPTANGLPHPGHCLTRAIKDLFPRYKTMRGLLCERKAGWDTHGLPVEVEVCKELGIHSKEQIEEYGIEPFIRKCQASVWRYMQEWRVLTERLGFWVDLDAAYVTYHQTFVESVWWSLKELFNRGLLYQGHKIVWWWAQGGTALSAGEVGQGYREVADPSVYVKFPLVNPEAVGLPAKTSLLVWTTTPWTLPSNQFAAVHPELDYAVVTDPEEADKHLIIATALVEAIAGKIKKPLTGIATIKGTALVGATYQPPFDYYAKQSQGKKSALKAGGEQVLEWRVVAAGFVTVDSGTGIVHIAPAFGEDDHQILANEKLRFVDGDTPELICAVGPDGKFTHDAPDYEGRWVKDCDRDIIRDLKTRGLLFHREEYLHDYPFCWRAEQDPLIQYPRKSWFIKTSQFKDRMLANNAEINWLPEHIKDGRFGNFLESNVDWALSRERYWGTPLPIWVCQQTGQMEAIGSYKELLAKPGVSGTEAWTKAKAASPELVEDLCVHKPYIDEIIYDSPFAEGAHMRRVPDVIDCWYDSGAMPFAQWGYPHQNTDKFREQFPADFISEALDQTRGWFYSQLAISTLLFGADATKKVPDPLVDLPANKYPKSPTKTAATNLQQPFPHPFKNCIVLGLMVSEWWESKDGKQVFLSEEDAVKTLGQGNFAQKVGKMSKSKRNYRAPKEIFDMYGADALRWYFFANQPPWTTIRYSEQAIKDSIPEFLLRLWNVYSFFTIYANIDGFDPGKLLGGDVGQLEPELLAQADHYRPIDERGELDRWIMSELHRTAAIICERMDEYDNFTACGAITAFVDALSNWYVRRSRERLWKPDKNDPAKLDAYWTLYECLLTTAKLIAPFTPFLAEELWQKLARVPFDDRTIESVHLCDYPTGDATIIDEQLSVRMNLVREISSLGRAARMGAKLKVRQPLAKVEVILADPTHEAWLQQHCSLIQEELNVKQVDFTREADQYITYSVLPDLKKLGPKIGKRLPALKQALAAADAAKLLAEMNTSGSATLTLPDGPLSLTSEELLIRLQAKPGWAAAQGSGCVVVLSTELTPVLVNEGIARELIHVIQAERKELNLDYTDRIEIVYSVSGNLALAQAITDFAAEIQAETLADSLLHRTSGDGLKDVSLGEHPIRYVVKKS